MAYRDPKVAKMEELVAENPLLLDDDAVSYLEEVKRQRNQELCQVDDSLLSVSCEDSLAASVSLDDLLNAQKEKKRELEKKNPKKRKKAYMKEHKEEYSGIVNTKIESQWRAMTTYNMSILQQYGYWGVPCIRCVTRSNRNLNNDKHDQNTNVGFTVWGQDKIYLIDQYLAYNNNKDIKDEVKGKGYNSSIIELIKDSF